MKQVHVGNIIVDSASFWIGDGAYVPRHGQGVVSELCGNERICRVNYGELIYADGITGYTPDGDGEYPVYAEYDDDGTLLRVILEFDEGE